MPFIKSLLLGGLAVSGMAFAGYMTYRWYTHGNSEDDEKATKPGNQTEEKYAGLVNSEVVDRVLLFREKVKRKATFKPSECVPQLAQFNLVKKVEPSKSDADYTESCQVQLSGDKDAAKALEGLTEITTEQENTVEITKEMERKEKDGLILKTKEQIMDEPCTLDETHHKVNADAKSVQQDTQDTQENLSAQDEREQFVEPITPLVPRPKVLEGVRTMKEFEMTMEALAAYLFTQNRSEAELGEAQQELGWLWHVVVAFKNRLPSDVPVVEQDADNGMETVD